MKISKKVLGLVLSLSLVAGLLVGCGAKPVEQGLKNPLVLGFDETFVPMGFKDKSGEYVGFDIDLAKEAAKRMGVTIEFKPIAWEFKETELNSGKIDMIWNGYTMTDERKAKVNFTDAYLDNRQIIVTLADSKIKTKGDLAGKVVATQEASSGLEAIEKSGIMPTFKNKKAVLLPEYNDAFMDLEAGRVDAVVGDEVMAGYYINKKGASKYAVLKEDLGHEEYGVGVRKEDTLLLQKLNEALNSMKSDGTAAEISKKWFEFDLIK